MKPRTTPQSPTDQLCSITPAVGTQTPSQLLFMQQKYSRLKHSLQVKTHTHRLRPEDIQQIGNLINIIAMRYSQSGDNKQAENWLRRAFKYCELSDRVRIVTYNNLACVFKQIGDFPMALMYITKAQKEADLLCLQAEDDRLLRVVTDCSLNLCAILSAMGDHYKALRAARKALRLLKSNGSLPESYVNSLLPIIKYNEAVQLERLHMYAEAETAYMEARGSRGVAEQLARRLDKAILEIKTKKVQATKQTRIKGRSQHRNRLSLPKFILEGQNHPERQEQGLKTFTVKKKRTLSKVEPENVRHYQSIKLKLSKPVLQEQNYYSSKNSIRIRKNVLESIQNF